MNKSTTKSEIEFKSRKNWPSHDHRDESAIRIGDSRDIGM